MKNQEQTRYHLAESDIPRFWYNMNADSPVEPTPVFNPATKELITKDALEALFPLPLIEQEITMERYVPIPDEVRKIYKLYRPTSLIRARRLEKALDTPAHIYFKYEGESPAGSHKLNSAIPQAFFNKISGTHAMTTETGAGQWGSALAMARAHSITSGARRRRASSGVQRQIGGDTCTAPCVWPRRSVMGAAMPMSPRNSSSAFQA